MSVSLYDISIPVFIRGLMILSGILKQGEDFAKEQNMDPSELLDAKLIDDMYGIVFQIQRCSDTAKGTAVRVGGVQNVPMEDKETTFAELQSRIQKTIEFLNNVDRSKLDGKEAAEVVFKAGSRELTFTGQSYVLKYAVPNFFFHVTTTYAILRMKGVKVGKFDYLGANLPGANLADSMTTVQ